MPVLSLSGAIQKIDGRAFLGPITWQADLSGITCVLGPNGAGKSLFLALTHGMRAPDGGAVTWDGAAATATRTRRSYVQQQPVVLRRTVRANVAFPLRAYDSGRVDRALIEASLQDKAKSPAATLSGGELRRMALARALVTDPQVLILDEPFAGLDPANAATIEAAITSLSARVPVLMSTHDLVQARRIASQILFVADGQLLEAGDAGSFFEEPRDPKARAYLAGMQL
ncbi:MAG: ATP-binding cassette domain-containing protein [Pseudomonadota bacterium]